MVVVVVVVLDCGLCAGLWSLCWIVVVVLNCGCRNLFGGVGGCVRWWSLWRWVVVVVIIGCDCCVRW